MFCVFPLWYFYDECSGKIPFLKKLNFWFALLNKMLEKYMYILKPKKTQKLLGSKRRSNLAGSFGTLTMVKLCCDTYYY